MNVSTYMTLPAGDLSATRQSAWVNLENMSVWGVAIHTPSTGTPVGTWSFEGSNDTKTIQNEIKAGTLPASTGAKKFVISATVVNGDALLTTGAGNNSYVAFSGGLPQWIRLVYTRSSGGTNAVPTLLTSGLRTSGV